MAADKRKLDAIRSDSAPEAKDEPDDITRAYYQDLELRSRKPAYRAEIAHDELIASLNRRIDVIQEKLDLREAEVRRLLPEVAELRQARRTSRLIDGLVVALVAIGGGMISAAGQAVGSEYLVMGFGWAFLIAGLAFMLFNNVWGWPPKRDED